MSEWSDINTAMDAAAQIGRDDGGPQPDPAVEKGRGMSGPRMNEEYWHQYGEEDENNPPVNPDVQRVLRLMAEQSIELRASIVELTAERDAAIKLLRAALPWIEGYSDSWDDNGGEDFNRQRRNLARDLYLAGQDFLASTKEKEPDDLDRYIEEQSKDPAFAAAFAEAERRAAAASTKEKGTEKTPFEQVTDDLTGGCGCACHTGTGYRSACVHCTPTVGP